MSLYLEHFGLKEAPFKITPHTEFFFSGGQRGALLQALHYAVMQEEGVIKVSGAVGSGKTMLCRMLGERLQNEADVIYLADPSLSRHEILDAIAADLRTLPSAQSDAPQAEAVTPVTQRLRALQEQLIARYAQGRRVVLLIDEAHAMPPESLEEIRLLSNLESNRHKLLQIVLFGQEELDQLLQTTAMRPLRDRVTQTFRLSPFSPQEVANYLSFRLGTAGCVMVDVFTPAAAQMIARVSGGLTRRINLLADKALLAAYSEGGSSVQVAHVKQALADCEWSAPAATRTHTDAGTRLGRWPMPRVATATLLVALGIGLGVGLMDWLQPPLSLPSQASAHLPAASGARVSAAPAGSADNLAVSAIAAAPAQRLPTALQEGLSWLAQAHDTQASLQLMVMPLSAQADVERFLQQQARLSGAGLAGAVGQNSAGSKAAVPSVGAGMLRAYRTTWNNAPALAVLYGSYDSVAAAHAALAQLPAELRALQPQVRLVRDLRQSLRAAVSETTAPAISTSTSTSAPAAIPARPASN